MPATPWRAAREPPFSNYSICGIRAALGADPVRILAGIFSRAFAQLAVGAVAGMLGAVGLEQVLEGEMFQGQGWSSCRWSRCS